MLQLRPSCECCDTDLPPGSAEARICSFEKAGWRHIRGRRSASIARPAVRSRR
jgi:hypothetical protein